MMIVDRVKRALRAAVYGPESVLSLLSSGTESQAGIAVDSATAMTCSAVIAAVRCLAETVAMLPLHLYRRLYSDGRRILAKATEHPLYPLLHDAPNPEQTSFEWREAFVAQILVYGNGFAEIVRDKWGRITALWPILAHRTRLQRLPSGLVYFVNVNGVEHALAPSQVFHVRGFNLYGLVGDSLIELARDSVGTALAGERWAAKFFANGARPGGIISYPRRISEDSARRLRESFESMHKGLANAQRVAILEEGAEYKTVGIDPEASQLLESRQYSVTDIARIFRLPPHKIGDLSRATFSNIEHQAIEFMEIMQPWFKRIEQRINMQLLTPVERQEHYAEFLAKGLLRTDTKTQGEFYSLMRNVGAFSANDIRELENMNPLPGADGDIYLVPANYLPASDVATGKPGVSSRRSWRAVNQRGSLREAYFPRIKDAAERAVRGEARELRKALRRFLDAEDKAAVLDALERFYDPGSNNSKFMARTLQPISLEYGAKIIAAASGEYDSAEYNSAPPGFLDEFIQNRFLSRMRDRSRRSLGQLQSVVRLAGPGALLREMDARIDSWVNGHPTRGEKWARREVVQSDGEISREIWRLQGAKRIIWRSSGSEMCPLCAQLDGKVIGIEDSFVPKGMQIGLNGIAEIDNSPQHGPHVPVKAGSDIMHPPLHRGCVCRIDVLRG